MHLYEGITIKINIKSRSDIDSVRKAGKTRDDFFEAARSATESFAHTVPT